MRVSNKDANHHIKKVVRPTIGPNKSPNQIYANPPIVNEMKNFVILYLKKKERKIMCGIQIDN